MTPSNMPFIAGHRPNFLATSTLTGDQSQIARARSPCWWKNLRQQTPHVPSHAATIFATIHHAPMRGPLSGDMISPRRSLAADLHFYALASLIRHLHHLLLAPFLSDIGKQPLFFSFSSNFNTSGDPSHNLRLRRDLVAPLVTEFC